MNNGSISLPDSGAERSTGSALCGSDERPGAQWPATVADALRIAAQGGRGATFVDREGAAESVSYARLRADALRFAALMRASGVPQGSPVLLQLSDARAMVTAVFGCAVGGYIATPTAVSPIADPEDPPNRKLINVWQLLDRPLILTDTAAYRVPEARYADIGEIAAHPADEPDPVEQDSAAIVLLTSGSTGTPKCVPLTHRALSHRAWAAARYNRFTAEDIALNWMPLDHVGGIVMWCLQSLFVGCSYVNLATDLVVADPLRWIDALDRYRVTTTWSANFGFAMTNKALAEAGDVRWDLSSLRHILDGGEAVVAATAHEFLRHLGPHGLGSNVLCPSWGMSETGSGVVYSQLCANDENTGVAHIALDSLEGQLRSTEPGAADAVTFTVTGTPIAGVELRIVDEQGTLLPPWRIGALHVRGETLFSGYLGNESANRESFTADGWFVTGDRAFLAGDKLVLAGRRQDAIVVNGINIPAHEVDAVVATVPGVRPGHAAVCSVPDEVGTGHRVMVFFTGDGSAPETGTVAEAISELVPRRFGFVPDEVMEIPEQRMYRTATGKIQRKRIVEAYCAERTSAAAQRPFVPEWRSAECTSNSSLAQHRLLVFADSTETEELSEAEDVVLVRSGFGFAEQGKRRFVIDPDDPADYRALYSALERDGFVASVVLCCWLRQRRFALSDQPTAEVLHGGGPASLLTLLQTLAADHGDVRRTIVLTEGACATTPAELVDPVAATALGMVRTAASEAMVPTPVLVDLDRGTQLSTVLSHELGAADAGPTVCYREGKRYLPALAEAETVDAATFRTGGTYVLTGGLGAIGHRIGRHLQQRHDARLIVVGRRDPDQDATAKARLDELASVGPVRYVRADAADHDGLRAGIEAAERHWNTRIDGAVHLAATLGERASEQGTAPMLATEPLGDFVSTVGAKFLSGWSLAKVLADRPDAALVLFSSLNGYFGGVSFGAYAAACSGLDGLAEYWNTAQKTRVHSLAWSLWEGTGLGATGGAGIAEAVRRRGFTVIDPERGPEEFERALATTGPQVLIGLDPEHSEISRLLGQQPESSGAARSANQGGRAVETIWEQAVATAWSEVIGCPSPDTADAFFALGGSSISAIKVAAVLGDLFEVRVPIGMLYQHQKLESLAEALRELAQPQ